MKKNSKTNPFKERDRRISYVYTVIFILLIVFLLVAIQQQTQTLFYIWIGAALIFFAAGGASFVLFNKKRIRDVYETVFYGGNETCYARVTGIAGSENFSLIGIGEKGIEIEGIVCGWEIFDNVRFRTGKTSGGGTDWNVLLENKEQNLRIAVAKSLAVYFMLKKYCPFEIENGAEVDELYKKAMPKAKRASK